MSEVQNGIMFGVLILRQLKSCLLPVCVSVPTDGTNFQVLLSSTLWPFFYYMTGKAAAAMAAAAAA